MTIQLGSSNKSTKKLTVQSWERVEGSSCSCSVSCVKTLSSQICVRSDWAGESVVTEAFSRIGGECSVGHHPLSFMPFLVARTGSSKRLKTRGHTDDPLSSKMDPQISKMDPQNSPPGMCLFDRSTTKWRALVHRHMRQMTK